MNKYAKRKVAVEKAMRENVDAYKAIYKKAEDDDRAPTDEERLEIESHLKNLETLKDEREELEANIKQLERVDDLNRELGPDPDTFRDGDGSGVEFRDGVQVVGKSMAEVKQLGDQFIESKGYKDLMERGLSGDRWTSGPIALDTKSTLATSPGTALTPREYVPGVVEQLFQRLYVSDLLGSATTNAAQVTFVSETTATNAAAGVAEQGTKPESALAFGETTVPVRKIATVLPVTDEMLQDAPQISAYINQRLQLFVKIQEEAQLLLGNNTAPNIGGIISTAQTIGTYARGTVDDNATALFKAMNGTRGSSFLDMDAIVIHPTNWQAIRLGKDSSGQFYGGGPFYGPYGGPQGPSSSSQFSADNLWGVRVVVTSAMTVGSALVGAFSQGAAVYRRTGITVEATNSHSTWFVNDITALRAEERLALAVYRPTAFTVVTGLA